MDADGNLTLKGGLQMSASNGGLWRYGPDPIANNTPGTLRQIIWNEQPTSGQPVGWVCIQTSPTIWRPFGIIS